MLRRDEICGYLRAVIQGCEPRGQSNKSLISLTGAAGLEPTIGAPVQVSVYPRETGAVSLAATGADLYRTKVTVTGQGEANRIVGFGVCLEDVLIKASGAQKLAGDRRLAAYKPKAKDLVRAFSYRDQFSGKPIRDEQGTRDRPYDLTVEFEESRIDEILK